MKQRNHTSYSEASLFMRCQYAHHLRYYLNLRRIQEADHLRLGSIVDKGMQAALHCDYLHGDIDDCIRVSTGAIRGATVEYLANPDIKEWVDFDTVDPDDPSITDQAEALSIKAITIANRVIKHLELGTDKWTTLNIDGEPAIQTELTCDIPGSDKHMLGYLDWVATNREGETYIVDLKVLKMRGSTEGLYNRLEDDWQLPLYAYALQEKYGIDIRGVAHLNVYGQLPKEPRVNKSGAVSIAACDTNWETYSNAVRRQGHDPNGYLPMKEKLDEKWWVNWTSRIIKPEEMDFAFAQLSRSEAHITVKEGNEFSVHTRTIFPMTCQMCSYRSYCRLDRQGFNAENLIGTEYYIKGEEASLVNIQRLPRVEGDREAE